ncbi:MAG TPA: hypothetical protein VGB57_07920 [Allosphingosinicella sp.]|jgi:hypothetical protein
MISIGRFDLLGCTASAFAQDKAGQTLFLPLGKAGSAYAAQDPARMRARIWGVRLFCAAATLILLGWLALLASQRIDEDPGRWRFGYALGAALIVWFLAYGAWAWLATRGLEKVGG